MDKILSLEQLRERISEHKQNKKKVVLAHGTFDLLHPGHVRHLMRAKQLGDILVVTVTADAFVNKGPGRPAFPAQMRAEQLAALAAVDHVAINYAVTGVNVIEQLQPHFYVKGKEYEESAKDLTGNIVHEINAVKACGGEIYFTNEMTLSSSALLNEHFNLLSCEAQVYLQNLRKSLSFAQLTHLVESLKSLKVLVIGDAILDVYHYVAPLARGSSRHGVTVESKSKETFAGGSLIIANHLAGLCGQVSLFTGLGEKEIHPLTLDSALHSNIRRHLLCYPQAPTVVKERFVNENLVNLLEVYYFEQKPLTEALESEACHWLEEHLSSYDAVVVPDYGHGLITPRMIELICAKSRFLAVNTQANSGNYGYHTIVKYPRADFVALNETEARLAAGNREGALEEVLKVLQKRVETKHWLITSAQRGSKLFRGSGELLQDLPPVAPHVKDTLGAGDAYLSVMGVLLASGAAPLLAAFLGNAAAALHLQCVGNRDPLTSTALLRYAHTLLK